MGCSLTLSEEVSRFQIIHSINNFLIDVYAENNKYNLPLVKFVYIVVILLISAADGSQFTDTIRGFKSQCKQKMLENDPQLTVHFKFLVHIITHRYRVTYGTGA